MTKSRKTGEISGIPVYCRAAARAAVETCISSWRQAGEKISLSGGAVLPGKTQPPGHRQVGDKK